MKIKSNRRQNIKKFKLNFKGNVYKYFDKHIIKSVPLYLETQELYLKLSDFFAK